MVLAFLKPLAYSYERFQTSRVGWNGAGWGLEVTWPSQRPLRQLIGSGQERGLRDMSAPPPYSHTLPTPAPPLTPYQRVAKPPPFLEGTRVGTLCSACASDPADRHRDLPRRAFRCGLAERLGPDSGSGPAPREGSPAPTAAAGVS